MILKSHEILKIDTKKTNIVLFYGLNDGHKNEEILKIIQKSHDKEVLKYDEKEVIDNQINFFESILSKSLFEKEKLIIIKRSSEKIIKILDELKDKKISELFIIIESGNLEKKSKLRSLFEKDKKYICIAFYPDNDKILSGLTYNFFKKQNLPISRENINFIVSKCNGDRGTLFNELNKLENYIKGGKKISLDNITKLINLAENHSISELVDNCLAKNSHKIINILNENNFVNEDSIIIIRTFIIKAKKILKLSNEFANNNNLDLTISSAKPPIFWKDKEITKQQLINWTPQNIKKLIYNLSEIELIMKKNITNSVNLITDFILEQSSSISNN